MHLCQDLQVLRNIKFLTKSLFSFKLENKSYCSRGFEMFSFCHFEPKKGLSFFSWVEFRGGSFHLLKLGRSNAFNAPYFVIAHSFPHESEWSLQGDRSNLSTLSLRTPFPDEVRRERLCFLRPWQSRSFNSKRCTDPLRTFPKRIRNSEKLLRRRPLAKAARGDRGGRWSIEEGLFTSSNCDEAISLSKSF